MAHRKALPEGALAGGRLKLLMVLSSVALVASACGGGDEGSSQTQSTQGSKESGSESGGKKTIAGEAATFHGALSVAGRSDTSLELDDYYFEPTLLKGKSRQKLTIELENEGENEHNFSIDSQQLDKDLEPGDKVEVEVTFPKSGQLAFYCKYHRGQGMAGGLQSSE
jgi:plastocyanin